MMTPEQYGEYLANVRLRKALHGSERMGQAYFNELSLLHPAIGEFYRGHSLDPFYVDEKIGDFLADLYMRFVQC